MKRLSLVLLVMVMVALVTSCATAATNVWLGDQVKTNSVKSTNYVQLMVQRPGTAGTGSNGLWRLIKAEDFISSLSLPQKNAVNTWTTSNIFNQHIWLADGKRLFVNGASLALDDGTGDTILNTFDDIRFQQSGVDKLVVSNGVLYGDGAGLTNVPGTGGGNTFNPNQFETNGASQVQIKSSASVTNLDAKGVTTASGITFDTGELQSDGRWLLGLESDHIDWVDLIGGGSWMKLYTNSGVQLDKLTNGTLNVKTQIYANAITLTNSLLWDGTGDFRTARVGDGSGSALVNRWEQGGLNGAWEWWDAPYSNSNKIMSLDVTAGSSSALRFYAQGGWTDASNYKLGQIQQNATSLDIGTYALGTGASTSNGMALNLATWGTNRLTIDPRGFVGIGTNAPTVPLQVRGAITAASNITAQGGVVIGTLAGGSKGISDSTSAADGLIFNSAISLTMNNRGFLSLVGDANANDNATNDVVRISAGAFARTTYRVNGLIQHGTGDVAGNLTNVTVVFDTAQGTNWLGGTTTITNLDSTTPCIGGLYISDGSQVYSITNTTYRRMTNLTAGALSQFTASATNGYMTNAVAGWYRVAISASFSGPAAARTYRCVVQTNDVNTHIAWQREINSIMVGSASLSGFVYLPANTAISAAIKQDTGEDNGTFKELQLNAQKCQ